MSDYLAPSPGPVTVKRARTVVHIHGSDGSHIAGLGVSQALPLLEKADATVQRDTNAALIAAAFDAAHAAAQLGYDPIEAVKALPRLLRTLETYLGELDKTAERFRVPDGATQHGIRAVLAEARGEAAR